MERKNWFNKKIEEVEKELNSHKENGLKEEQIVEIQRVTS